jgi:hypothetical protein
VCAQFVYSAGCIFTKGCSTGAIERNVVNAAMRAGCFFLSFVRTSRCTRVARRVDYITAASVLVRCSCLTLLLHQILQKKKVILLCTSVEKNMGFFELISQELREARESNELFWSKIF